MQYLVNIHEVHIQPVLIDAESEQEALEGVEDGEGKQIGEGYYSYTLDKDTWSVSNDIDNPEIASMIQELQHDH